VGHNSGTDTKKQRNSEFLPLTWIELKSRNIEEAGKKFLMSACVYWLQTNKTGVIILNLQHLLKNFQIEKLLRDFPSEVLFKHFDHLYM